jgi:hypothetical protein
VIVRLIQEAIEPLIDPDPWNEAKEREREQRELLKRVRTRWDDVEALLRDDEDEED